MFHFDLDTQRGVACLVGLFGLLAELVITSVGISVPDALTGAFVTLAIGPVITATIEKMRREPPAPSGRRATDEPDPDDETTDTPPFTLAWSPAT